MHPAPPGQKTLYKPTHKVRFVTAASLFDGHDATINIMRRILQSTGVEVIHLGHNRSVQEIVNAALQEDVQGIAITSYQGGHVEFFKYMIDLLKAGGGENIKVFGGGGGVIVPEELSELHAYGVSRIYTPEDGQSMGLQGMINEVVEMADLDLAPLAPGAGCGPGRPAGWRPPVAGTGSLPDWKTEPIRKRCANRSRRRQRPAGHRCSASPAPAARANPRSPTSWSAVSASTRRTASSWPSSASIPPANAPAAPCSATASA